MDMQIHTSTPIVNEKLIPPPPRRLWGHDSATEQLYRNKWEKYRNSIEEKEPSWSGLDAPCYVDFADIPEAGDSYFDHAAEDKFATPQKTWDKPLPGSEENNNVIDLFRVCSLSTIKKPEPRREENELAKPKHLEGRAVNLLSCYSDGSSDCSSSTIKNDADEMDTEVPKAPDIPSLDKSAEKTRPGKSRYEKKNQSDERHCTITEPFSFEEREKCRQEHKQARRERDSAGKEILKGFRANPVPNFIKLREKKSESSKPQSQPKKPGKSEMHRLHNAAEIWKKKAFQPSLPKKVMTLRPKAPELMTEIRARERQRFQEQLREKERQREVLRRMEEAARQKREEEEIAKLRRELVHKAQPIRHYRTVVPKAEKRPLAEPMTPITCKRRRQT